MNNYGLMKVNSMNEIASYNYEDISKLVEILTRNHYVCMVSVEDSRTDGTCLWVLNYIKCIEEANRNEVVFMSKDDFYDKCCTECEL